MTSGSASISADFNPRSHEGSDVGDNYLEYDADGFQSTLPRGERPGWPRRWCTPCHDFNPRSHEGSDEHLEAFGVASDISIHAPTRGATRRHENALATEGISIHAPTRGATVSPPPIRRFDKHFNPRSHEGSDRSGRPRPRRRCISIHAPTRGATTPLRRWRTTTRISIHAPTRGATVQQAWDKQANFIFQSTLPRGERQQFSPKSSLFSQQKLSKIFNLNNKLF